MKKKAGFEKTFQAQEDLKINNCSKKYIGKGKVYPAQGEIL